jgi:hypothetical protein
MPWLKLAVALLTLVGVVLHMAIHGLHNLRQVRPVHTTSLIGKCFYCDCVGQAAGPLSEAVSMACHLSIVAFIPLSCVEFKIWVAQLIISA